MSFTLVALMLRTGTPVDVWMRQPEGVIETALILINEASDGDDNPQQGYSG